MTAKNVIVVNGYFLPSIKYNRRENSNFRSTNFAEQVAQREQI